MNEEDLEGKKRSEEGRKDWKRRDERRRIDQRMGEYSI